MVNVNPPAASAAGSAAAPAVTPVPSFVSSAADIDTAVVGAIDAAAIARFHDRQVRERDWPIMSHVPVPPGIWHPIDANHRYNGLLWREQDRARRLDVPPADIAAGRRLIARYHEKRGDALEAIDVAVLAVLGGVVRQPGARLSNETVGELVDCLSMLALQLHQMRSQPQPQSQPHAHEHAQDGALDARIRASRIEHLSAQRQDAMARFDTLLAQVRTGTAYFKLQCPRTVYRDASPNPYPSGRIREQASAYDAASR